MMVVPIFLVALGVVVLMYGSRRHWPRALRIQGQLVNLPTPHGVAAQHIRYFQEGTINHGNIQAVRSRFEVHLARRNPAAIEAEIEGGLQFLVAVRALVAIGTEEVAALLERLLERQLSDDPTEQGWYRVDLARALRELNHSESLTALLRLSEQVIALPFAHLYCAELVMMPHFGDFVAQPLLKLGRHAVRVLLLALEGIRRGMVPGNVYADAQLGELVHRLAESCPDVADPLLTRVFIEALRHRRRAISILPEPEGESPRRHSAKWQTAYLRDAEPVLLEYLHGIGEDLVHQLITDDRAEHLEILDAIAELRVDASRAILRRLSEADYPHQVQAVRCLCWATDRRAGMVLRGLARKWLASGWGVRAWLKRGGSGGSDELIEAVVFALRGHPGTETEELLLRFVAMDEPSLRAAALRTLGWTEPIDREKVVLAIRDAQRSESAEIRRQALAAQARLGECLALSILRDSLSNSDPQSTHEIIDLIAEEGLTWLWPDLDLLTEADDPGVASHAWEAIERLRESLFGPVPV